MAGARERPDLIGTALIAGGGIGGLAAALAIAQAGRPVVIAERRSEWSEAGAGIQISPNGVRVLEQLGVAEHLAPAAGVPEEIVVRQAKSGQILQRLPLGAWIKRRHGAPYWQVHRRDLQAALLARVAEQPLISVHKRFEVVRHEDSGDRVRIESAFNAVEEGALLIGADGVFSGIRGRLFQSAGPRFAGRTAARTVIAADRIAADAGEPPILDARRGGAWLAPGAHIVHYPVRAGREIAVVVVETNAWSERGWSAEVRASEVEAAVARIAPPLAQRLGRDHDWRRWALFEAEPMRQWSRGRVTLLGDAAHPTLPFLAQGGVMALEDARVLGQCLKRARSDADIPAALAAYEQARVDRANKVVAAARRNDFVFHLKGPAAMARNAAMRVMGGERVIGSYDWVYGWKAT